MFLDMENKRRASRLECAVPIDGKEGSVFANTQAVDISKGGIGFISPKRLSVNRLVPMELDVGEGEESILVVGRVTWTRKIRGTSNYRIGLIFEEALPGSKSRLNKYFKNL